jgi:AbrB family looped-hinge helix DNA binding protein
MKGTTVRMSSKAQVVIPAAIRKSLKLKKGQQFQVIQNKQEIVFRIQPSAVDELYGILKGKIKNGKNLSEELINERRKEDTNY